MTVLLAAFLALQAGAPAPAAASPAVNEDIVIIGQRLTKLKARVSDRRGKLQCRVKKSSGDAGLDSAFCAIAIRCVKAKPANAGALSACMTRQKDEMMTAMAASRARDRRLQGKE
jgi:hypothetical protein